MRVAKKFDPVSWEIVKPSRNLHLDAGRDKKLKLPPQGQVQVIVNGNDSSNPAVDFFVDIGAIVETEIMRRDLLGHADAAGCYGNIVAIRGKNVGTLGPLMEMVEIPIDCNWVRSQAKNSNQ